MEIPMKRIFSILIVTMGISYFCAASEPYGGIRLLNGYQIKRQVNIDGDAWNIQKNGFTIKFESGPSWGVAADPARMDTYSWYREQNVNGCKVILAMVKPGQKTVWEPENSRGMVPGNILLVTFVLSKSNPNYTANFWAKVANQEELIDMLLMVMTFDPSKYD
jgi:hypothetical protein